VNYRCNIRDAITVDVSVGIFHFIRQARKFFPYFRSSSNWKLVVACQALCSYFATGRITK
jgi:hypothetical protein